MAASHSYLRSIVDQDGAVILDIRQDRFFSMNPVGSYIWTRLLGGECAEQIAKALADETGVELTLVSADVHSFIADLKSNQLCEI